MGGTVRGIGVGEGVGQGRKSWLVERGCYFLNYIYKGVHENHFTFGDLRLTFNMIWKFHQQSVCVILLQVGALFSSCQSRFKIP